ncbi:hypothetical protein BDP27DRAFT_1418422 [Rhodocollybia butyracea]|uniref:Protein kinase domain-containing protein n=1 Tax=Rhodocollybia butyracea TaxID=206335 RepID=A0A9P5UBG1_9AGAR|nr:hypothetical protein BDP27DRAFT_1418422 [Rhodocollybia butyracea]
MSLPALTGTFPTFTPVHVPMPPAEQVPHPNLFSNRLAASFEDPYEQRVLRVVVMAELFPIVDLTNPVDLEIVFRDVFQSYRWLYEHANLLHRDLSTANIMFRRGSNGRVHGVLNDFDHPTHIGSACSHQRAGTAPFMAIDLNAPHPPVHLYRHDLESLYYVLVRAVCPPDHQDWFSIRRSLMADAKRSYFFRCALVPQRGFEGFSRWMEAIHDAFEFGLRAQSDHLKGRLVVGEPYDNKTLGGNVSFDSFSVIFNDNLAEQESGEELEDTVSNTTYESSV